VRIWDAATGRERARLDGHTGPVAAVAVAPDGTWLATGSADGTVRIWDAATGRERARLDGHTGPVAAVAVAPDGTWLATGSADGTVRVWRMTDGTPLVPPLDLSESVRAVAAHGTVIITAAGADIAILQPAPLQLLR
jgi:WD40 repeat protein